MKKRARASQTLFAATLAVLLGGCGGGSASPSAIANGDRTIADVKTGTSPLIVTVSEPTIDATPGATVTVPCAIAVAVDDTSDTRYKVTAWGTGTAAIGSAAFPIENYPATSALAWSLDGSTTYVPVANSGSPGQSVFTSIPNVPQSHCVNLRLSVPATLAAGTYHASIDFHLYAGSSSLLSLKAIESGAVAISVGTHF